MKEKTTDNLSLKIIAVLFAASLWMISININDPYQSKDYSVVVQLQNMNVLTGAGKHVEVVNDTDEITVKVRGNRSVMDSFSSANIVATADLNKMNDLNQVPISLSTVKTSGSKIESIRSTATHVEVKVENIKRVQKKLEVVTKNLPKDGYILGKVTTEQNALRISGPESAVALVDKAVVNFDLQHAVEDVSMILPVELYDAQGNRIYDSRLVTSIEEVQCIATVLAVKEIPLVFAVKGNPSKGYEFTGEYIVEPETIMVAAKANVLRGFNKIEIGDVLELQGVKDDVTAIVDVKEYLPENIILADQTFDGKVNVTAMVEEIFTQEVAIPMEQIRVVNVPEKVICEPEEIATVTAVVSGFVSARSQWNENDIQAKVDVLSYMNEHNMMELEAGTYEMDVVFELPEGIWIEDKVQIQMEIIK